MNASEEEFVPEEEAEEGPALVKRLREKLKKAVEEKQEYLEGWQRARADFVNFKKEEAARGTHKEGAVRAELVGKLLPVLDSFEMAFKHKQSKEFNIVHKQLLDALRAMGVEPFGKVGEEFDPYKHEALAQQEDGHTVVSIERSGYSVGKQIIRPAQVILGKSNG